MLKVIGTILALSLNVIIIGCGTVGFPLPDDGWKFANLKPHADSSKVFINTNLIERTPDSTIKVWEMIIVRPELKKRSLKAEVTAYDELIALYNNDVETARLGMKGFNKFTYFVFYNEYNLKNHKFRTMKMQINNPKRTRYPFDVSAKPTEWYDYEGGAFDTFYYTAIFLKDSLNFK